MKKTYIGGPEYVNADLSSGEIGFILIDFFLYSEDKNDMIKEEESVGEKKEIVWLSEAKKRVQWAKEDRGPILFFRFTSFF